jgi:lambda repressor-like predicted transcriptional regulator
MRREQREKRDERIRKLARGGLSIAQLAREFGLTPETIEAIIGYKLPDPRQKADTVDINTLEIEAAQFILDRIVSELKAQGWDASASLVPAFGHLQVEYSLVPIVGGSTDLGSPIRSALGVAGNFNSYIRQWQDKQRPEATDGG